MTKGHGGAGGHGGGLGSWVSARTQEDCFEQPVGVSTVTVVTVLLPNEPRDIDGGLDAGIFWEKPYVTQIKAGFMVWPWSGYLSIFSVPPCCLHSLKKHF